MPMPVEHYVLVIDIKTHKTGPEASILVRMRRSGTEALGAYWGSSATRKAIAGRATQWGRVHPRSVHMPEGDDSLAHVLVVVPEDLIADTPVEWTGPTSGVQHPTPSAGAPALN